MTTNVPSEAFIVGDDGLPIAHIDIDRLQSDATMLMYEMAATAGDDVDVRDGRNAGDDAATDAVGARWAASHEPTYFGYLCAAALSLTVRHVLAPTLDVAAEVGVDLRPGLQRACDDALRDLGGEPERTEKDGLTE
jgi:hypothetical protein